MTRMNRWYAAATVVLLVACEGQKAPAVEATPPPNDAQRAAAVANALTAMPTKTDSILTANGLTTEMLQELMMRVASDSSLSAQYGRLTKP